MARTEAERHEVEEKSETSGRHARARPRIRISADRRPGQCPLEHTKPLKEEKARRSSRSNLHPPGPPGDIVSKPGACEKDSDVLGCDRHFTLQPGGRRRERPNGAARRRSFAYDGEEKHDGGTLTAENRPDRVVDSRRRARSGEERVEEITGARQYSSANARSLRARTFVVQLQGTRPAAQSRSAVWASATCPTSEADEGGLEPVALDEPTNESRRRHAARLERPLSFAAARRHQPYAGSRSHRDPMIAFEGDRKALVEGNTGHEAIGPRLGADAEQRLGSYRSARGEKCIVTYRDVASGTGVRIADA